MMHCPTVTTLRISASRCSCHSSPAVVSHACLWIAVSASPLLLLARARGAVVHLPHLQRAGRRDAAWKRRGACRGRVPPPLPPPPPPPPRAWSLKMNARCTSICDHSRPDTADICLANFLTGSVHVAEKKSVCTACSYDSPFTNC